MCRADVSQLSQDLALLVDHRPAVVGCALAASGHGQEGGPSRSGLPEKDTGGFVSLELHSVYFVWIIALD